VNLSNATNEAKKSLLASPSFFEEFAGKRSWESGWLADFRKENWEKATNVTSNLKDERWRFSPKARLGYSKVSGLAKSEDSISFDSPEQTGFVLEQMDKMILENPNGLLDLPDLAGPEMGAEESFLFARAFSAAGFYLRIEKNTRINRPLLVNHCASGEGLARFHHNLIVLEPFSEVTLIEKVNSAVDTSGGFFTNLTHINVGEGAKIQRILVQDLNELSSFHNLEHMAVSRNASLSNLAIHLGSAQTRVESKGSLTEEGAELDNSSITLGQNEQLFDQRTMQHHLAANGKSTLTFKNALLDKSKSIFSGLIKVENEAQVTNAYQNNRNLLLSDEAEADSMPGLEILANEVKCSHGATTSKIDEQELFYLLSRGIPRSVAERLIVLGFFEEVVEKISPERQLELIREKISQSFDS
jgi:Fe-S cluster assembly protein SufD